MFNFDLNDYALMENIPIKKCSANCARLGLKKITNAFCEISLKNYKINANFNK